jgi:lipopolysaccharide/colanic/teichoic acid biosynthesis glycosyltransferase
MVSTPQPNFLTEDQPAVYAQRVRTRLPERLSIVWTIALLSSDVFAVLAAAYAVGLPAFAGPAACVIVCGALAICGAYQTSYAVRARDEIYHVAAACALAAIPLWALLHLVTGIQGWLPIIVLVVAGIGISLVHVVLHCARYANSESPFAGARCISPQAHWRITRPVFFFWKCAFDVSLSVLGLLVLSPVMLATAAAIAAESNGPIFFRQDRLGRSGTHFGLFKFRTMRPASGSTWARPGDLRITRVGAFLRRSSLDELPQLFNVLRGEMSLVGPRPEMIDYARRFSRTIPHYDERHVVRPGLTGWAQVQLKRNLRPADMPDVLPYDLFYIEHVSPLLDAVIVFKTAAEFIFHRAV